jgi:hypothetical protein
MTDNGNTEGLSDRMDGVPLKLFGGSIETFRERAGKITLQRNEPIILRSFSYLNVFRLLCAHDRLLGLEHKLLNSSSSPHATWTEEDDKDLRYRLKDYCCLTIPFCAGIR